MRCGYIHRKSHDGVKLEKKDFLDMPIEEGVDVNFETPDILQAKDGDLSVVQSSQYSVKKLF